MSSHRRHDLASNLVVPWALAAAVLSAVVVAGVLCPICACAATADDLKKAEALATEGKVYFRSKLYEKSADKFMQAFGISRRPALVYNAARAYEEGKKLAEAIAMFEHYRTLTDADAKGKTAAGGRIAALKAKLAASQRDQAARDEAKRAAAAREKAANSGKSPSNSAGGQGSGSGGTAAGSGGTAAGSGGTAAASGAQAGASSARLSTQPRVFPLWRGIGAGTSLLFAGAAYANAYRIATNVLPADVVDEATRTTYKDNQGSAQTWQVISVGAAAIGLGLAAWASWDWLKPPPSGAPVAGASVMLSLDPARQQLSLWGQF